MNRFRTLALTWLVAAVTGPGLARADDSAAATRDASPHRAAEETLSIALPRPIEPWELVAAPALLASAAAVRLLAPLGRANITSAWPGDDAVESALSIGSGSPEGRAIETMGDLFYLGSLAHAVVDPLLSAGLVHGDFGLALELQFVSLESFAFVASTLFFGQLALRRARPNADGCREPGGACGDGEKRSLPGGHLAIATTQAALTCQHHLRLGTYENRVADAAVCGFFVGGAALTFVSRIVTRDHHFSDQLLGMSVGLVGGLLLPWLLHYRAPSPERHPRAGGGDGPRVTLGLAPMLDDRTVGLGVFGIFDPR